MKMFGHDVAEDYLIPYNEKIWKRPLDNISADWVYIPGRLPIPSVEDIVKAVAGIPVVGYKEQSIFIIRGRVVLLSSGKQHTTMLSPWARSLLKLRLGR